MLEGKGQFVGGVIPGGSHGHLVIPAAADKWLFLPDLFSVISGNEFPKGFKSVRSL